MKLKAILDSVDDIPEAIRPAYVEKDGKCVLQIDGIQSHPDTKAMQNAMENAKTERNDARKERDELKARFAGLPEDFTLEEYNRLKDAGQGDIDKRLDEQKARLTKQFDTEKATITADLDKHKAASERLVRDAALAEAMTEANVAPQFLRAVKGMFKDDISIAYEGEEVIATIKNVAVKDAIKAWAATDEGKAFVAADGNSGGGGQGGKKTDPSTDNPWAKETFNLTQQGLIMRADPAKAERLRKAAGGK